MQASFIGFARGADEILLVCSRDLLPRHAQAPVDVRAARQGEAERCQRRFRAVRPGRRCARGRCARPQSPGPRPTSAAPAGAALSGRRPAARPLGRRRPATPRRPARRWTPPLWQWGEVRSGIATITAPMVEAFVPQMLNYESVGGVNFKKGCYPGQEVVARSQFRGTLKRRAFIAHADAELAAGQEVFQAADPEQPAGIVAQAAPAPGGGWDAIVSLQLAAARGRRPACRQRRRPGAAAAAPALPAAGRRLRRRRRCAASWSVGGGICAASRPLAARGSPAGPAERASALSGPAHLTAYSMPSWNWLRARVSGHCAIAQLQARSASGKSRPAGQHEQALTRS